MIQNNKRKKIKAQVTLASVMALLLVITVTSITFIYWFSNFSGNYYSKFDKPDVDKIYISSLEKLNSSYSILNIKADKNLYQFIESVSVNGNNCLLTHSNVFDDEYTPIYLNCDIGNILETKNIVIITNYGLFEEVKIAK